LVLMVGSFGAAVAVREKTCATSRANTTKKHLEASM
jgi:hypothetical protein